MREKDEEWVKEEKGRVRLEEEQEEGERKTRRRGRKRQERKREILPCRKSSIVVIFVIAGVGL